MDPEIAKILQLQEENQWLRNACRVARNHILTTGGSREFPTARILEAVLLLTARPGTRPEVPESEMVRFIGFPVHVRRCDWVHDENDCFASFLIKHGVGPVGTRQNLTGWGATGMEALAELYWSCWIFDKAEALGGNDAL